MESVTQIRQIAQLIVDDELARSEDEELAELFDELSGADGQQLTARLLSNYASLRNFDTRLLRIIEETGSIRVNEVELQPVLLTVLEEVIKLDPTDRRELRQALVRE